MPGTRLPGRLSRFAIIGAMSTLIYALVALFLSNGYHVFPVTEASLAAYVFAALFSYAGHKYFTFVSHGSHSFEGPRFVVLTLLGLALSFVLPTVLSGIMSLPAQVPIALTCVLVPVVNYMLLRHWVFAEVHFRAGGGPE